MTRLLVSIRDLQEARIAFESGADLIDLKEPRRGSLGACDLSTITSVIGQFNEYVPVSVALGELRDEEITQRISAVRGATFAKIGLADCAAVADWELTWQSHLERLPPGTQAVGVVYADNRRAASPKPETIVQLASRFGCAAALVDTFDKSSGALTEIWGRERIGSFILEVQRLGMLAVLAGSLREADLASLLPLRPDVIAVRGAVCQTSRTSSIDGRKVARWKALVASPNEPDLRIGPARQLA